MKTTRWLVGALGILGVLGAGFLYFLYKYRVENEERVGKAIQPAVAADAFSHELFNQVLQKYVDAQGRVNYAALKSDSQALESYLDLLAAASLDNLHAYNDQLAFWIDAYNALTIKGVLDHYPTTSVRQIKPLGGFFRRINFQVGGQSYTLNDIEHGIIRSEFAEPRIHFALVCASAGCPILENRAFFPDTLDEQLEKSSANFINNSEKVRLDRENRVLYLSKIFEWYAEDFEDTHDSVLDFIAEYLSDEDAAFIKQQDITIQYLAYDWRLNDQARK
ncbi:MAG: DUF547 domain-containing protein [Candidatus Poribacteria bacterium]|nr:DUF547 domain-containing protein [Candidatus Poribacteria bacterium]